MHRSCVFLVAFVLAIAGQISANAQDMGRQTIPISTTECMPSGKTCSAEDLRWGCGGEKLRNLLDMTKCLDARVQAMKEPAAISDVSRANARLVATALYATHFLTSSEDWKRIYRTNMLDEKAIAAIKKFQGPEGDGWLRSDELVKLVCTGAMWETGPPYLKYYLGWMYATGQGVTASGARARELLGRAEDVFNALNTGDQYKWYIDHINMMLRKIPYDGGEPGYSYCPDFSKFSHRPPWGEMEAQLNLPLPIVGFEAPGPAQNAKFDLPPIRPN